MTARPDLIPLYVARFMAENPGSQRTDFNITSIIDTEIKGKCGPETGDPAAYREAAPAGVRSPATDRCVPRYTQEA